MAEYPRSLDAWHEALLRFEASTDAFHEAVEDAKATPGRFDGLDVEEVEVRPTVRWRDASDDYEDLT